MSYSATKWAWGIEGLTSTQRLVLLALAWEADGDGNCELPIEGVLVLTGLKKSAVFSVLDELVSGGFLFKQREYRSVRYKLHLTEFLNSTRRSLEGKVNSIKRTLPDSKLHQTEFTPEQKEKIPQTPLKEKAKVLLTGEEAREGGECAGEAKSDTDGEEKPEKRMDIDRGWPEVTQCPVDRRTAVGRGIIAGLSEQDVDDWFAYHQSKEWRRKSDGFSMVSRDIGRSLAVWRDEKHGIKARREQAHGNSTTSTNRAPTKRPDNWAPPATGDGDAF